MKTIVLVLAFIWGALVSCNDTRDNAAEDVDTTTNAVRNAEGTENNAYNLPGSDTGAIHENTSQPGVLDMDARDSTQQPR